MNNGRIFCHTCFLVLLSYCWAQDYTVDYETYDEFTDEYQDDYDYQGGIYSLHLDDEVDNALLLGGFGQGKPLMIRSDGLLCKFTTKQALTQGSYYVNAGAIYVPEVGVIKCGGDFHLAGKGVSHLTSCTAMESTRPSSGFLPMPSSHVPIRSANVSTGRMQMVLYQRNKIILYADADNNVFKGQVSMRETCAKSSKACTGESFFKVKWTGLNINDLGNMDFGGRKVIGRACLVDNKGDIILLGGLDTNGAPVQAAIRIDPLTQTASPLYTLALPSPTPIYFGCTTNPSGVVIAGGVHYLPRGIRGNTDPKARFFRRSSWLATIDSLGRSSGWSTSLSLNTERADFGMITLRTGHRDQRRTMAMGGLTMGKNNKINLVGSVEMFDPVQEFWYPVQERTGFKPFPATAQFTVVRVPVNFSASDADCNCVPDPNTKKCYSSEPGKRKGKKKSGVDRNRIHSRLLFAIFTPCILEYIA